MSLGEKSEKGNAQVTILHPLVPLVRNERLGESLHSITFRSEEIAERLMPGNFVHIRVSPEMDPLFRRAMSVHSCDADRFTILFRVIGRGTRILSQVRVGDQVDLLGPLGNSFAMPEDGERPIMVAGGTGVPPLHFLTQRLIQSGADCAKRAVFLCGISSADDIALVNSVEKLGVALEVSSDDGSVGHRGFVTDLLRQSLTELDPKRARVYACGPNPMLRVVAQLCSDYGVRCQVSLEGNMPCGIGTCLGCVVRSTRDEDAFDRICREGPVFYSDEVVI